MKQAIFCVAFIAACLGSAHAELLNPSAIEKQLNAPTRSLIDGYSRNAMAGDYQAMRNIAFAWSTDAARQDPRAAIVGCAWYAQIMELHKAKVHAGDASNRELYCGRLSRDDLQAAAGLSARLGSEIKGTAKQ